MAIFCPNVNSKVSVDLYDPTSRNISSKACLPSSLQVSASVTEGVCTSIRPQSNSSESLLEKKQITGMNREKVRMKLSASFLTTLKYDCDFFLCGMCWTKFFCSSALHCSMFKFIQM